MTDQTAARFRKRPVEIDALHLGRDNFRAAVRFVPIDQFSAAGEDDEGRVFVDIRTLEGTMRASEGDWIIRGVKGEHYPCKPDVFQMTYESAAAPAGQAPATDRDGEEADADTVANRAAQVISNMGAEIRALKGQRDRYRSAWCSARERARAYGEGILRHVADRDFWRRQYNAEHARHVAVVGALVTDRAAVRAEVLRAVADHLETLDPVEAALAGQHAWRDAAVELRRKADEAQEGEHVCEPGASVYYCPASGENESDCHGGFDVCCDRPDLHQPAAEAQQPEEAEGERVVAYISSGLYCTRHQNELGAYLRPVLSDDLPDGGTCCQCGADVLIPQQPKEAGS